MRLASKPPKEMAENKSASFEGSLERLQAIVKELEADGIELERSVALYREGRELVGQCETMLRSAEATLRQAAGDGDASAAAHDDSQASEIPF